MSFITKIKYFFTLKKKIDVTFFTLSGTAYRAKKIIKNGVFYHSIHGTDHAYVVDFGRVYYNQKDHTPTAYYHEGNPQPLDMSHRRNDEVDSVGFRDILDSKIVQDLFSDEKSSSIFWILIISGIIGVMMLLVFLKQYGIIKVGG